MSWHTVIGLEIHVQLATDSKLFSRSPTTYGSSPNSQANSIDMALPGTLPVLNQQAIDYAIMLGHATDSKVNPMIAFDRKNYFYPDLPKGYQITQHYHPILLGGHLDIELGETSKRIRLHHSHLEEDAGKSMHQYQPNMTGIDLNRAGVPLVEVVSEPDMRSPQEAVQFMKTLHHLVVTLRICDGNMQEGSFRCDANVSIRQNANAPFGTRVEIKNINSFKFVEKALNYEIKRQIKLVESGQTVKQQTRLFNEQTQETVLMREKEQAHDYRYHPDPDIPFITISDERIKSIKQQMPELPRDKRQRLAKTYDLPEADAKTIAYDLDLAHYFESTVYNFPNSSKTIANLLLGQISALVNKYPQQRLSERLPQIHFEQIIQGLDSESLSIVIAKKVLEESWETQRSPDQIIQEKALRQITDPNQIQRLIEDIIVSNPKQHQQYLDGQEKLYGFFVGQVMKKSEGKADPKLVNELLKQTLLNSKGK